MPFLTKMDGTRLYSDGQVCQIENAKLLAKWIPKAELHNFDYGRHMFFIEFRQQVDRLIRNFLMHHPL